MPELVSKQAVHDELEETRAAFRRLVEGAPPADLRRLTHGTLWLATETETDLQRGMYYPVRWDPFFKDFMTLADIYHYPSLHYGYHQRQLTLTGAPEKES